MLTDYDTADRLYFEPLTLEDVLEVIAAEQAVGPVAGAICQLGPRYRWAWQPGSRRRGCRCSVLRPRPSIWLRSVALSGRCCTAQVFRFRSTVLASSVEEAEAIAAEIGYPVLVRPSYVLGGRGMEIVYDQSMLASYIDQATQASPEHPVLVDQFLDDAIEIDVDALFDGSDLYIGGVMEHIEEAGIHSGDSACALPPITLGRQELEPDPSQHPRNCQKVSECVVC